MDSRIKVSLGVDGEAKFKRAISESEKSIKNLNTRLTLATAEFKRDGDAMKLMEEKSKTLSEEIDRQKEIVKALESAVGDAAEKYGQNSAQAEHWEAQLNKAKATLANMQTELANNEEGLDKNGRAYQEAAEEAESFSTRVQDAFDGIKNWDFKSTDQAITNLRSSMQQAAQFAIKLGTGMWDMVSNSSTWADDLITLSTQLKVPLDELQGWSYAARLVDTEVDTIATAMSRLAHPSKDVTETIESLGVQTKDAAGQLRSKEDVFWDLINVMNRMGDSAAESAQQDSIANQIFGKSFKELQPLINAGRETWDAYIKEARDAGLILSDDQVGSLGSFNDALQRVDASITALKNNISSELAPAFTAIADAFGEIVTKFNLWAQSEQGQKSLGQLNEAISSVVKTITENTDFNQLAEGAAGVITGLGDALGKIANDPSGIITNVGAALAVYAGLTVSQTVLSLIKLIGDFGSSAAGAAASVGKLAGAAAPALGAALPGIGIVGTVTALAAALDDLNREREFGWTKKLQNLSAGIDETGVAAIKAGIQAGIQQGIEGADSAAKISEKIKTEWQKGVVLFQSQLTEDSVGGKAFSLGEMSILKNWVDTQLGPDAQAAIANATAMYQSVYDAAIGKGFTPEQAEGEATTLLQDNPLVKTALELKSTKEQLDKAMEDLYAAGNNATQAEIDKVTELMGQVEALQERLGILKSDTATYAKNSYELVSQGKGTTSNMGAGVAYVITTTEQAKAEAQAALDQAEKDYTASMIAAAGDTAKEAAAVEQYTSAVDSANTTLEQLPMQQAEMLMNLLNGSAMNAEGAGRLVDTVSRISDLTAALSRLNSGEGMFATDEYGDTMYGENGLPVYIDEVRKALDDLGMSGKSMDAITLFDALNKGMAEAMQDLDSQVGGAESILAYMESMADNVDMDSLDLSKATGAFAAALRTKMIMDLGKDDGQITIEELAGLWDSDAWKEIGSEAGKNLTDGVGEGVQQTDKALSDVDDAANRILIEFPKTFDEHSPSKITKKYGMDLTAGVALGIETGAPAAVASAFRAASAISEAFAQGLEANLARIQSAVSRMNAAAAAAGGPVWSGRQGSYTYTSNNSSIYVGNYNNYNGADLEGLDSALSDLSSIRSAGYGS